MTPRLQQAYANKPQRRYALWFVVIGPHEIEHVFEDGDTGQDRKQIFGA